MTEIGNNVKAYTKQDLEVALTKIKAGMKIKQASKTYKIPRGTLQNRIHGRTKQSINCSGPPPVLSKKEEEDIVLWIEANARKGFPRRENDLLFVVKEFLYANPRENPFTDNMPGRSWYKGFHRRHPIIRLRKPEGVSSASAKVSETDIRRWFEQVGGYLEENGLMSVLEDPTRVYNADETSFLLCPKTGRVLAPKGMKNVYEIEQGTAKEAITTLFTYSAAGQKIKPLIVYPYIRVPNDIRESIPADFAMDKSETGWMNQDVFYDFIKNVFHPDLVEKKIVFPVILFVDGHKSHLSLKLSDLCTELKIVLICLPPNATRIMQPADVSCFKPVKNGWTDAVEIWRRKNPEKILTKVRFAKILKIVVDNSIDEHTIKNGFRACGLMPFDVEAVDYTKFLGKSTNYAENMNVPENNKNTNSHLLSPTNAIDLQRFAEIVGETKLLALNQFNPDMPCSSDFSILHKIFEELSQPNDELALISESLKSISLDSHMEIDRSRSVAIDETIIDKEINSDIINMDGVIVLDPKEFTLENFLIVPPTPVKKGKNKNSKRERQFVMTSEIHKMEERIKLEEKLAKEKATEERKQKLEERKRKLEDKKCILEEKKQKLEYKKQKELESKAKKEQLTKIRKMEILKKAEEREEKKKIRTAEREEKKREKEQKKLNLKPKKKRFATTNGGACTHAMQL